MGGPELDPLEADMALCLSSGDPGAALGIVGRSFPRLPNVNYFHLEISRTCWEIAPMMRHLPSLKTFSIGGDLVAPASPSFLPHVVWRDIARGDGANAGDTGSPEEIHLTEVRLGHGHGGQALGFLGGLLEYLQARKDRGKSLKTLPLSRCCNVVDADVECFRDLVGIVIWDGAVYMEPEVSEDEPEDEDDPDGND